MIHSQLTITQSRAKRIASVSPKAKQNQFRKREFPLLFLGPHHTATLCDHLLIISIHD